MYVFYLYTLIVAYFYEIFNSYIRNLNKLIENIDIYNIKAKN